MLKLGRAKTRTVNEATGNPAVSSFNGIDPSWDGMSNLLNTVLIVSTLQLSIVSSLAGSVSWEGLPSDNHCREVDISNFWTQIAISASISVSVSIFTLALFSTLSLIDHEDKNFVSLFYNSYTFEMIFLASCAVLNFWVLGNLSGYFFVSKLSQVTTFR